MKIIELIADPETRESTRLEWNDSATAGRSGTDNGAVEAAQGKSADQGHDKTADQGHGKTADQGQGKSADQGQDSKSADIGQDDKSADQDQVDKSADIDQGMYPQSHTSFKDRLY